jgi:hypothetical protein
VTKLYNITNGHATTILQHVGQLFGHQRTRCTTNFATSQHPDMSRCWTLVLPPTNELHNLFVYSGVQLPTSCTTIISTVQWQRKFLSRDYENGPVQTVYTGCQLVVQRVRVLEFDHTRAEAMQQQQQSHLLAVRQKQGIL